MGQPLKIGDIVRINEKRRNWTPEELHDVWEIIETDYGDIHKLRSTSRGTICLTPNNDPGRQGWVTGLYLTRDEFLTAVRAAALSTTQKTIKEKSTV